ncbi:hypothetical protein AQUCO_01000316v1 [Aquilegia coerulea]|uniref:AB hydrolase-1 domain-containing protein n=1 Tax=Aquilegia coerulea TaxID=218851 RepID=A0A2G5E9E2_AQUCA|nr:hypothetical protein AQUCO_01000316v1 [Aquilegia coerulea]
MLIACADSLILSWSIFKTGHHTLRREDLRIIERMMSSKNKQYHFVLVHGLGHGAWCWYKVRTLLESVGHQVTALDLAASGVNLKTLDEVHTMLDYSQPLLEFMETIPMNERVIIVGNSLGGFSLAYAMDKFPEKISVAVFVAAFMPDTSHGPSYVMDKRTLWILSLQSKKVLESQRQQCILVLSLLHPSSIQSLLLRIFL